MSGPTPITQAYRFSVIYTVQGLTHKCRFYCDASPGGGSSGWNTVPFGSFAAVDFQDVLDKWNTLMAPFYKSTDTTFNSGLLEQRTGSTYVFVASMSSVVTPSGSSPYEAANGMCFSGRDKKNENIPTYLYEGFFGAASKYNSYATLGSNTKTIADALFNVNGGAVDEDPYAWSSSRDQWQRQRWIALVIDTNEKLRRLRHIK